jgi:hypothetical protein
VFDPQKRHRSVHLFLFLFLLQHQCTCLSALSFYLRSSLASSIFVDKDFSSNVQTSFLYKDRHLTNTRTEIDAEEPIYSLDFPNNRLGLLWCIARHLCSSIRKHTASQYRR